MNERESLSIKKGLADEEIIELYWNRNETAITETDKKYGKYLYTIAYNIIHDNLDCEECLNDTYFGVWNRIPPTRPSIFHVFLSRITRNIAVDKYRKASAGKRIQSELVTSLEELDECIASDSGSVEEELAVKELASLLSSFIRGLDERAEFIFVCRYYYADKISSIAKMLGISENTVFRELADIRRSLKAYLTREGYYDEK